MLYHGTCTCTCMCISEIKYNVCRLPFMAYMYSTELKFPECKAKQNNTFVSCNIGLQNRVGR